MGLGHFDPGELERGAAALKDIDASQNAAMAFTLGTMQERTAQLEKQLAVEKERVRRAQLEESMAGAQADESRKTISHMADQERATAQHKAQVESQMQSEKLQRQRAALEYQLQREQEQFQGHEGIRIRNE